MAWTIDPVHTSVGFSVRHMGLSTVRGKFDRADGKVELDPADLTQASGHVEIDVASINTGNADRDTHLKSADFFDAANHPRIVFDVKRIEGGGEEFKVVGALTIRGITHEVELDAEFAGEGTDPYGNHKVGGSLTGTINRKDFGLTWNVPLEAGGLLVGDKVKIEVEGQLVESKAAVQEEVAQESASAR